jgi:hypothetical protein
VTQYAEPIALLADLQITPAVTEGLDATAPLEPAARAALPNLAGSTEFERQINDLQQQIDAGSPDNAVLGRAISRLQQLSANSASSAARRPMLTADVRRQMQLQVRAGIQLHEQGRALKWQDVVHSAGAAYYLFQVSDRLGDVEDAAEEECVLPTGDLLQLDDPKCAAGSRVMMRVLASKPGSCAVGSVMEVPVQDVQAMLNDFVRRQEANMTTLKEALSD